MEHILKQNTDLTDKIAEEYQTPSEKLKKDPIMALVTRTISTYMLIKHSKNGKEKSQAENLSPWGVPFFSKPDHNAEHRYKSRMPRGRIFSCERPSFLAHSLFVPMCERAF